MSEVNKGKYIGENSSQWKGGISFEPYPLDFNGKLKRFIRERDNYTCQLCGEYGDIVDHIVPWAISHDSSKSNLRTLCRQCNLATRREPKNKRLPLDEWYKDIEVQLASYDLT